MIFELWKGTLKCGLLLGDDTGVVPEPSRALEQYMIHQQSKLNA